MFFFFNDTATTEIYTLSLHDALPISDDLGTRPCRVRERAQHVEDRPGRELPPDGGGVDRKSTRLNSSHGYISYAVFCLKKKKRNLHERHRGLSGRHRAVFLGGDGYVP